MSLALKALLKELLPPIVVKACRQRTHDGFWGNYSSWQEAQQLTSGYDSAGILEKVKQASLKVKNGEAVYERDSVLFNQIHYSFPILASLLRVAVENQGKLSVLDFGGSLGSSYYQCRDFLSDLTELRWNVVEQKNFVDCGKQFFEDESLKFFVDIEKCLAVEQPQIVLLSSVLQYLEKPYDFLEQLIQYKFPYLLFDRTAFVETGGDRLTIQKVSPTIYPASYPAWFFHLNRFLECFKGNYEMIVQFDSLAGLIELRNPGQNARDMGFLFQKGGEKWI
ncbi:MAG: methyltransferase, TIGR04325 family [Scytolyngbya sp. HA4215-MV1]|jgi:putative methyltransferase (TIGR04325 family)|nr:methyltransferase, TIGR04325 family [Scytolyngbya sp. HA4215-MV1]